MKIVKNIVEKELPFTMHDIYDWNEGLRILDEKIEIQLKENYCDCGNRKTRDEEVCQECR